MKNSTLDLNNHLMAEIERLGDEDLEGDNLALEIRRAEAITRVAQATTANARLILDASKFIQDNPQAPTLPTMLVGPDTPEAPLRLAHTSTKRRRQ